MHTRFYSSSITPSSSAYELFIPPLYMILAWAELIVLQETTKNTLLLKNSINFFP